MNTPRKYKKHTLLRKKEAKLNNFRKSDTLAKFAMIKRQKSGFEAFRLFNAMGHEYQLEFIRKEYRGFKVDWRWRELKSVTPIGPVHFSVIGYALEVKPKVGKVKFKIDLVKMKTKLNDEATLVTIRHHLPTVKAL
jgi:hypothetical protein